MPKVLIILTGAVSGQLAGFGLFDRLNMNVSNFINNVTVNGTTQFNETISNFMNLTDAAVNQTYGQNTSVSNFTVIAGPLNVTNGFANITVPLNGTKEYGNFLNENPFTLGLQASVLVLYTIGFVVATVGNALVIIITYKKPETRTTITYLFLNLTIADLMVALIIMPYSTAYYFLDYQWDDGILGNILCKLSGFGQLMNTCGSIFTLTFIALNRYVAVVHPLRRRGVLQRPIIATVVIWLSSLVLVSPLLQLVTNKPMCMIDWDSVGINPLLGTQVLFTFQAVVLYLAPLAMMAVLYSILSVKLYSHKAPGNVQAEALERTRAGNRKVVHLTATIVAAFAVCYLPAHLYHLIVWCYPSHLHMVTPEWVMFLCFWFAHLNSALNPCIYIALNTKMRRAFIQLFLRNSHVTAAPIATPKVAPNQTRNTNSVSKETDDTRL